MPPNSDLKKRSIIFDEKPNPRNATTVEISGFDKIFASLERITRHRKAAIRILSVSEPIGAKTVATARRGSRNGSVTTEALPLRITTAPELNIFKSSALMST